MDDQQKLILNQIRKHVQQCYSSIQEAFLAVDTDRSGSISLDEFETILKVNNVRVNHQELLRLAEAFDANRDGRVSYEEFCRTVETGPYVEASSGCSRRVTVEAAPSTPPAKVASTAPATREAQPSTPRIGLQLSRSASSDARARELLSYFRKAVEQCYGSLNKAFIHIDADRSGFISAQELIAVLYEHNIYPTWQELKDLIELLDVNGDGVIDYNEFGRAMHGRIGPASPTRPPLVPTEPTSGPDVTVLHKALRKFCTQQHDSLRDAFRRIDATRTGVLTEPELLQAVRQVVPRAQAEEVQLLFQHYDLNHDGLIQYNEFVKAMSYDTL